MRTITTNLLQLHIYTECYVAEPAQVGDIF